ncbi:MAG: xanthan lyase [Bacteroidales bacterium]|nr:xanthan lyase [Bacteroidales bacterium]
MKLTTLSAALMLVCSTAFAQNMTKAFKPASDSINVQVRERTTVTSKLSIEKVLTRNGKLDIYFSQSLSDFHWTADDIKWLKQTIKKYAPKEYQKYDIGTIRCKGGNIEDLATPSLGNDGKSNNYKFAHARDPKMMNEAFITRIGAQSFPKGMSDRYISLWQSHGRYFEEATDRWEWQRATVHRTVEDMYTQSYVLPFLIPMLENAGAYVLTPRERDTQIHEVITDNDPAFSEPRTGLIRKKGVYSESGSWKDAGEGFADAKIAYVGTDNPFKMGTARQAACVKGAEATAKATWTPDIPEQGEYAVYISYKTLKESTKAAHYTVHHRGGDTEFTVNQQMGGGTWIYLGTFEFAEGTEGYVSIDNACVNGEYTRNSVITADGVKIGGGMGKIARGLKDTPVMEYVTSGLPCFTEGAMYWMQYAGVEPTIWKQYDSDYTNDYASRGAWTGWMAGGSWANPKAEGLGIPFDLSLAFHTDAGTTMDDSTIGVLSIYTLLCDGSDKLPNGTNRMAGRLLAGHVQDQIVDDIRADFDPTFSKRFLWDRSYSESRTTSVPGMLLELLSHQNFADMKYGLDPTFRFTVSRAIYKGMLKFMSDMYKVPYVVQPLAVNSFSATWGDKDEVILSWKATEDTKEPTAMPTGYILYTRVDDEAFDQGVILRDLRKDGDSFKSSVRIEPGHVYSYKIVAFNEGGKSFPSEILCAGKPTENSMCDVIIVNNFDRVSAPTWFDGQEYAGFDGATDGGMAYGHEINYVGDIYQFRRELPWMDDDNPGFGACHSDHAGELIPGNTFDFVASHAKSILAAGYGFCSASRDAYIEMEENCFALDLLCGKQVTTKIGRGAVENRFQVFPVALQERIKNAAAKGTNIIISGANIGTDVWDKVYPVEVPAEYTTATKTFVTETLGYKWLSDHGCATGEIAPARNAMNMIEVPTFAFHQKMNKDIYCVENPDGILPVSASGAIVLRYTGNDVSAAVSFTGDGYKVMSYGFPLETVVDSEVRDELFKNALEFFKK